MSENGLCCYKQGKWLSCNYKGAANINFSPLKPVPNVLEGEADAGSVTVVAFEEKSEDNRLKKKLEGQLLASWQLHIVMLKKWRQQTTPHTL